MTAGLKCAPEMAPKTETATASASPLASAIPTSPTSPPVISWATTAPTPIDRNMNVPAASASSARPWSVRVTVISRDTAEEILVGSRPTTHSNGTPREEKDRRV